MSKMCPSRGVCVDNSENVCTVRNRRSHRRSRRATTTTTMASTEAAARAPARDASVDLECDDEFEEFEAREWEDRAGAGRGEGNGRQWEEDWDDADAKDDFSAQLRAELERK